MFFLVFVVFCIVLYGLGRLSYRADPPAGAARRPARTRPARAVPPQAETIAYPGGVQERWTALDDRQLTRLLDDSAPC